MIIHTDNGTARDGLDVALCGYVGGMFGSRQNVTCEACRNVIAGTPVYVDFATTVVDYDIVETVVSSLGGWLASTYSDGFGNLSGTAQIVLDDDYFSVRKAIETEISHYAAVRFLRENERSL